jgi:glycosyltransferase involved in cell wall biosynthesis
MGVDEIHLVSDEEHSHFPRGPWDLEGILRLHGMEFLESAYLALLLRKPDATGIDCYLPRLREGMPKIQVLRELADSGEARRLDVELPGLKRAVLLYRLGKLPLAGRLLPHIFRSEGDTIFDFRLRSVEEALDADFRSEQARAEREAVIDDPNGLRALVGQSGLFDPAWYREQSPRLGENVDPLGHYLSTGGAAGRSPSPAFNAMVYLLWYPDVRRSGANPLVHYLTHGKSEGRRVVAVADAAKAGSSKPVPVTAARIVCLKHQEVAGEVALFVTHSPDGLIKPHVVHFVSQLKGNGIAVVMVIAADMPMQPIAPEVADLLCGLYVRENKGYDFGAWAHVLQLRPALFAATILYLINDSNFGPLNGARFAALLERIRSSTSDIVGLTDSHEHEWHVQSYFLAFKAGALSLVAFHRFINSISILSDKDDVIQTYELKLASHLRERGLKIEVIFDAPYVPIPEHRFNKTLFYWKQLIEEGSPFVKVGALRRDHADIDTAGWREIVTRDGYDPGLIDYILAQGPAQAEAAVSVVGDNSEEFVAYVERLRPQPSAPLRVALIGPWNYDNGLGFASRGYISALCYTDFLVNIHAIRAPFHIHKQMAPMVDCQSFSGDADLVIVHLNPDGWFNVLNDEQRAIISRARKVVGAWVWETQSIPANWYPAFDLVDAIWAPSRYCADIYGRSAKVPVEVVPYFIAPRPIAVDRVALQAMRDDIGIARDQRVILYCFDGASYLVRKNPAALITAFWISGLAREGWVLVLKTKNLFDSPAQGRKLQDLAARASGVILVDKSFDPSEMDLLMNIADIYASPHCSEGFGMTIAEAMALEKTVVATDYGGSRDFVDETSGFPVRYSLQTLTVDHGHYTRGTVWADIDKESLVIALRAAADKVASGDLSIARAGRDRIATNYSARAIGQRIQSAVAAALGIQ